MGAGGDEQRVWEEHQPREGQDSMLQARERVEKDDIEQDSSTENGIGIRSRIRLILGLGLGLET
jgi:hypothetical protein